MVLQILTQNIIRLFFLLFTFTELYRLANQKQRSYRTIHTATRHGDTIFGSQPQNS